MALYLPAMGLAAFGEQAVRSYKQFMYFGVNCFGAFCFGYACPYLYAGFLGISLRSHVFIEVACFRCFFSQAIRRSLLLAMLQFFWPPFFEWDGGKAILHYPIV